jgi:hypothetical protein
MSAQGCRPRGRAGQSLLLVKALQISLVGFGVTQSDARGQESVAAARIEKKNMSKISMKREPVAKEKLWVHRPPPEPEHVKLVGEWNCVFKSEKKDVRRCSFEFKQ